MSSHFDSFDKNITLTDKELFTKLYQAPKDFFAYVVQHKYDKYFYLLMILFGIYSSFSRATTQNYGDKYSLMGVIFLAVVVGGLLGWISLYFYAGFVSLTGSLFGGKAYTKDIVIIFSYAFIPNAIALLLVIIQIIIYGNEMFKSNGDFLSGSIGGIVLYWGTVVLELVLNGMSIILAVIGLAEIQKFSILKAFLNLFFPIFIIVFLIALIFGINYIINL